NVINLGQGNPDLPIDNQVVEKLQQAAQKPVNDQYPPFGGHDYFREAVADFYKREYDVDLDPDTEVAVMIGSKIGLFEVCQCMLNPHDTVLLTHPGYPDYLSGVRFAKVDPSFRAMLEENEILPVYTHLDG